MTQILARSAHSKLALFCIQVPEGFLHGFMLLFFYFVPARGLFEPVLIVYSTVIMTLTLTF